MRCLILLVALFASAPSLATPPRGGKMAGQGSSPSKWRLVRVLRLDQLWRSPATARPQTLRPYKRGDVYLDYPSEDVRFRYENKTGKVFRQFYGQPEVEVSHSSNLFRDAMSAGKHITREQYLQPVKP